MLVYRYTIIEYLIFFMSWELNRVEHTLENEKNPLFWIGKEFFEHFLEKNNFINLHYVSREKFDSSYWNFFYKNEKQSQGWNPEQYDLYVPDDLQVWELAGLILRFNKKTFWDNLPVSSATETVEVTLKVTIVELLAQLKLNSESKIFKKAIKKYVKLFEYLFPYKKLWTLNLGALQEELQELQNNENGKKYKKIILRASVIKKEELLNNIYQEAKLYEIEKFLWWEMEWSLLEAWFEDWTENFQYAKTFSKQERNELLANAADNNITIHTKWKNIYLGEWEENITIWNELDNNKPILDEVGILITEKIDIHWYIVKLTQLRKTGTVEEISHMELEVMNKLLVVLSKYAQDTTDTAEPSSSKWIIQNKRAVCQWRSQMAHYYLTQLWINHDAGNLLNHSILIAYTANHKEYYYDPTNFRTSIDITWKRIVNKKKYGQYEFIDHPNIPKQIALVNIMNVEEGVLAGLLSNLWSETQSEKLSLYYDEKSLTFDKMTTHINIWYRYYDNGEYKKYIEHVNAKIHLYHDSEKIEFYNTMSYASYKLWKIDQAHKYIDKALVMNSKDANLWDTKWDLLFMSWKYKDAIKYLGKAININNSSKSSWVLVIISFLFLGRIKDGKENYKRAQTIGMTKEYFINKVSKYDQIKNNPKVVKFIDTL